MLPRARIVHRMAGRMRVLIASRRRDAAYFDNLKTVLEAHTAIESATVNPITGTVLILGSVSEADIGEFAEEHELFQIALEELLHKSAPDWAWQAGTHLDRRLQAATHGRIDAGGLVFLALATAGTYQVFKRRILPPAATLLWYAYEMARVATGRRP